MVDRYSFYRKEGLDPWAAYPEREDGLADGKGGGWVKHTDYQKLEEQLEEEKSNHRITIGSWESLKRQLEASEQEVERLKQLISQYRTVNV